MRLVAVGFLCLLVTIFAANDAQDAGTSGLHLIDDADGTHQFTLPPLCPPVTCPYEFYRMDQPASAGSLSFWSCYNPAWNAPYFTVNILSKDSKGPSSLRQTPWDRTVIGQPSLRGTGKTLIGGTDWNLGHAVTL